MSHAEKILEALELQPKATIDQIRELLPELTRSMVSHTLGKQIKLGMVVRTKLHQIGKGGAQPWGYSVNPDPRPATPQLKLVKPTEAGLQARLEEARARVAELETWKAEAIARFPELGVDPEVIKARKIASDVLRRKGDNSGAADILAGRRDNTAIMEATLAALELGVAA